MNCIHAMNPYLLGPGLSLVFILLTSPSQAQQIEIKAGNYDRHHTPTQFALPEGLRSSASANDDHGNQYPIEVRLDGTAVLIVNNLKAGESMTLTLSSDLPPTENTPSCKREGTKLSLSNGKRQVVSYQMHPGELPREDISELYRRGGYLHPVQTPSGIRVTDDYPSNHTHHHGIWFPWTKTQFEGRTPDFWNMGRGTGRVEFVGMSSSWSGCLTTGFTSKHQFVDMVANPEAVALREIWKVALYKVGTIDNDATVIDLESKQRCAGQSPLILPEYRYGGMGFRGRWEWNGPGDNCRFLTSNGERDRVKGHATRAKWCWIGGPLNGSTAGIAILSHPKNFRAPQPMRIHPTEPFFNFAPQQAGDMAIEPRKTYTSRYRYIAFEGEPEAKEIERWWQDYAYPPQITVSLPPSGAGS